MSALVERVARAAKPSLWRAFDAAPDSHFTLGNRRQELVFTARLIRALLAEMREPSEATQAVVPYHTYGWLAFQIGINAFASEHGLEGLDG